MRHDIKLILTSLILLILLLFGLMADQIAVEGGLIPFGPHDVSRNIEIYSSPGTSETNAGGEVLIHYFGTDDLGRDVASRLIHGITVAYKVGVWSTVISFLISLLLGGLSGYKGNSTDEISILQAFWWLIGIALCHFYARELAFYEVIDGSYTFHPMRYFTLLPIGLILVFSISQLLKKLNIRTVFVPYDSIVLKLLEVFASVPKLFMLLAIFSIITRPSLFAVIVIIGCTRWPSMTRLIRAEVLKIRQEDFIKSARLMGLPTYKILMSHVLPNIYKSILILIALNIGSAILIESSLSFLQIGLPIDEVSWGRMLEKSRDYIPAWWMAVGPGMLIFIMILSFKVLGDRLSYHFETDM